METFKVLRSRTKTNFELRRNTDLFPASLKRGA